MENHLHWLETVDAGVAMSVDNHDVPFAPCWCASHWGILLWLVVSIANRDSTGSPRRVVGTQSVRLEPVEGPLSGYPVTVITQLR